MLEGFILRLYDKSYWIVKGVSHPPNMVRAYPRLLGRLKIHGMTRSINIVQEIYPWLLATDPCYRTKTPLIPLDYIEEIMDPRMLKEKLRGEGYELIKILENLCGCEIGVTGSFVFRRGESSDLDIIVYGEKNAREAYRALQEARLRSLTRPLSERNIAKKMEKEEMDNPYVSSLEKIFARRGTSTPLLSSYAAS